MKPWLKNSNDPTFNEFYTTREQCEIIFDEMIPIINEQTNKDKITVCCPCDDEQSEIPKYLLEHTNWTIDYFGDLDMNSEEARERMLKADVIITNPPFKLSEWRPFVEWLIANKKQFFIFGPILMSRNKKLIKLMTENTMLFQPKLHKSDMYYYNTPNGTLQRVAATRFYTSFKVPVYDYKYRPAKDEQYYEGIPVYDKVRNVPKDYYDWMYVPVTAPMYLQPCEIDATKKDVPNKFVRVCVRRKNRGV